MKVDDFFQSEGLSMSKVKDIIKHLYFGEYDNPNEDIRKEWVIYQLNKLEDGATILDAGAGECQYKKYCSPRLKYVSQDFCQYEGSKNFQYGLLDDTWDTSQIDIISDITDIAVADESFDAVLCTEVLEHVPHPEIAIKELSRVLKSGGKLILTAPFCSLTHFAPYHYCTGFNIFWYEKILEENGLLIIDSVRSGNYYLYMAQEVDRMMHFPEMQKNIKMIFSCRLLRSLLKKHANMQNDRGDILCFEYMILAQKK